MRIILSSSSAKAILFLLVMQGMALDGPGAVSNVGGDASKDTTVIDKKENSDSTGLPMFTLDELASYNGSNGRPAYVAVDGVVYDVTPVRAWRKGKHKGRHFAGAELGEEIRKKSPHGIRVLKKLKVVGRVVSEKK